MARQLLALLAALLMLPLALAACGGDEDATRLADPDTPTDPATPPDEDPPGVTLATAYALGQDQGDGVALVAAPVMGEPAEVPARVDAALFALTRLPDEGHRTAVPATTEFGPTTVDGGVATVELSDTMPGASASAESIAAVTQLVWTVTSVEGVDAVTFTVEGMPTDVLTGAGIVLDGPQTRDDWPAQT